MSLYIAPSQALSGIPNRMRFPAPENMAQLTHKHSNCTVITGKYGIQGKMNSIAAPGMTLKEGIRDHLQAGLDHFRVGSLWESLTEAARIQDQAGKPLMSGRGKRVRRTPPQLWSAGPSGARGRLDVRHGQGVPSGQQ